MAQNEFLTMEEKKTEPKKEALTPIASGTVKKRGTFATMREIFISEDASTIGKYITMDVLVPTIKNAISTIFKDGIDILLYGTTGNPNKGKNLAGKVSYSSFYDARNAAQTRAPEKKTFWYDELEYPTRDEAVDVINSMDDLLSTYGQVSVADMYELSNATPEYTYNNYGWKAPAIADIHQVANITRRGNSYLIKLPRPMPLK